MKFNSSSEWFELDSPIGEPEIKWTYSYPYLIERIVKITGEIIWFGQRVNWKKEKDGIWTVLGEDENVKPTEVYYNLDGSYSGASYPEGRIIWIPCEEPIYETLYKQVKQQTI